MNYLIREKSYPFHHGEAFLSFIVLHFYFDPVEKSYVVHFEISSKKSV